MPDLNEITKSQLVLASNASPTTPPADGGSVHMLGGVLQYRDSAGVDHPIDIDGAGGGVNEWNWSPKELELVSNAVLATALGGGGNTSPAVQMNDVSSAVVGTPHFIITQAMADAISGGEKLFIELCNLWWWRECKT